MNDITIELAELATAMPPSREHFVKGRDPYPERVCLDWTDYCNAKCFFCPREEYEKQIGGSGGFIPFSKLKHLEES